MISSKGTCRIFWSPKLIKRSLAILFTQTTSFRCWNILGTGTAAPRRGKAAPRMSWLWRTTLCSAHLRDITWIILFQSSKRLIRILWPPSFLTGWTGFWASEKNTPMWMLYYIYNNNNNSLIADRVFLVLKLGAAISIRLSIFWRIFYITKLITGR